MKRFIRPTPAVCLASMALLVLAGAVPGEKSAGPDLLGDDLSKNWTTTGNWKLDRDGVVTLTPRPGEKGWQRYDAYLWSKKEYKDFDAEFEYKVEKGGNSGFYFHVGDKKSPVAKGIEVQIYDSAGKKPDAKLTDHDSGGIIPGYPPSKRAAKPAGEWNKMRVVVKGGKVNVTLNGEVVNEVALDSGKLKDRPGHGYIGFQDHGLPLWLRNVRVREESDSAALRGQRVFTCGHSFHMFVPPLLADMAKGAGLEGHEQVGRSSIGGSLVIAHWKKNGVKEAVRDSKFDVLTLSPIFLPDDGIEKFARLAVQHNPKARITVQEFWLPFDLYDLTRKIRPAVVNHDAQTAAGLRKLHEPYFKSMDDHVRELNRKLGREALFVVPAGQAVIALREKIIAGEAPGLKKQGDLFSDAHGHARPPLQALVAYCHFAVIYRRSPVGLPLPEVLVRANVDGKLNRLLQELAWEAVTSHPLSGVGRR